MSVSNTDEMDEDTRNTRLMVIRKRYHGIAGYRNPEGARLLREAREKEGMLEQEKER